MLWSHILRETTALASNPGSDPNITDVVYDSRQAGAGSLFVAMRGGTADGNRYIRQVRQQGAAAVITDSRETFAFLDSSESPVALVEHGRRALAQASAAFFAHPERQLATTAVTGTNGKTTTAFLTEALLARAERTTLLLGTVETRVAGRVLESKHTTPEARDLYALFRQAVDAGATEAVMEMSSHALDQERVFGIPVDVAIFTNLTQDHLDYHGTMDSYAAAKARLFQGVGAPPPRVAIVNADDAYSSTMLAAAAPCQTTWRYSLQDRAADFFATDLRLSADGTRFALQSPFGEALVTSPLVGRVNVYNLAAAIAAALARGLDLDTVVASAAELAPVPGRFESVANTLGLTVLVDYAHTDDALTNVLNLARELAGNARVLTLFGCGGDRDRTKRPKMGRAAALGSDLVVITSDNPRSEDPATIAAEALQGVREAGGDAEVVLDRAAAIAHILRLARKGDIVILAGKGHEKTQTANGSSLPFDDVAVAAAALRTLEHEQQKDPRHA
ncbi:UDP-N-acetylmuramoyl-L-alanyl-D-glutamate--2,6-diaminopimelate ligase [Terriglobus aquaticus]|uniref:UDP-N-acetylmuramoyl-L-alanyl-D-glutamate--2,6-diaminopimelate ligase n=1 Tax=Terriglobus aquaticus TaxID=940139 RepID=A0ABW9KHN2_9BACT|nr:UDP-N-acetylmuramoyl-L-alanyl-D-glutamate--2,6-diaminopimelate ligase [Terriglobus aquaticus]